MSIESLPLTRKSINKALYTLWAKQCVCQTKIIVAMVTKRFITLCKTRGSPPEEVRERDEYTFFEGNI